jgi:uncharacterized protein (DUF779 family)
MEVPRVAMTDAAATVLRQLVAQHGPLLFHQSGGCCDGSAPMCFPRGEFRVGERDCCELRHAVLHRRPAVRGLAHPALIDVVPGAAPVRSRPLWGQVSHPVPGVRPDERAWLAWVPP